MQTFKVHVRQDPLSQVIVMYNVIKPISVLRFGYQAASPSKAHSTFGPEGVRFRESKTAQVYHFAED